MFVYELMSSPFLLAKSLGTKIAASKESRGKKSFAASNSQKNWTG